MMYPSSHSWFNQQKSAPRMVVGLEWAVAGQYDQRFHISSWQEKLRRGVHYTSFLCSIICHCMGSRIKIICIIGPVRPTYFGNHAVDSWERHLHVFTNLILSVCTASVSFFLLFPSSTSHNQHFWLLYSTIPSAGSHCESNAHFLQGSGLWAHIHGYNRRSVPERSLEEEAWTTDKPLVCISIPFFCNFFAY